MNPAPRGCFITGTDTGVGKTWIALGLLRALRNRGLKAAGMKPVASGAAAGPQGLRNDDALAIQGEANVQAPYDEVNPYCFASPIAPHIAASEADAPIRFSRIEDQHRALHTRADFVVVEGVGGWRVPLGPDGDVAALARSLGHPVVLVVGLRLGCINHALLTAEALAADGAKCAGWIANGVDADYLRRRQTLGTLQCSMQVPLLAEVPWMEAPQPEALAAHLKGALDYLCP
jgi:dethiobiotin synthetase